MGNSEKNRNILAILTSTCVALLLMQGNSFFLYAGIAGVFLLIFMAFFSPWLGLLAVFPLAFSLPVAPHSMGVNEYSFASLLGAVFFFTLLEILRTEGLQGLFIRFKYPLMIGLIVFSINLFMAIKNSTPLTDWIRGIIPFLFVYTLIPIAVFTKGHEGRIHWLGISIGTLILLASGHIVVYYFYNELWKEYWLVLINGESIKVPREVALGNPSAIGPYSNRITMALAQATDALLPIGLVAGIVVGVLARDKKITITGMLMSLLCASAILITFTRSMLLSATFVIGLFFLFIFLFHKALRKKAFIFLNIVLIFTILFVFSTGMQGIWLGRLGLLIDSTTSATSDFNVSSRIEEYQIAWKMFLEHPVLGNGFGIKHEMRWETPEKISFTQSVAYVHNWPLYILMVGGAMGFLTYLLVLFTPVAKGLRSIRSESIHRTVIRAVILTMVIYACFFAVFRLITFNLILAAAWGVLFTKSQSRAQRTSGGVDNTASTNEPERLSKNRFLAPKATQQNNMELSI